MINLIIMIVILSILGYRQYIVEHDINILRSPRVKNKNNRKRDILFKRSLVRANARQHYYVKQEKPKRFKDKCIMSLKTIFDLNMNSNKIHNNAILPFAFMILSIFTSFANKYSIGVYILYILLWLLVIFIGNILLPTYIMPFFTYLFPPLIFSSQLIARQNPSLNVNIRRLAVGYANVSSGIVMAVGITYIVLQLLKIVINRIVNKTWHTELLPLAPFAALTYIMIITM